MPTTGATQRGKPVDAGTGQVCASFDAVSAAWLSVGTPHATHGFVELAAVAPFDERRRGDAAATREHRLAMTDPTEAVLAVEIDGQRPICAPSEGPAWIGDGVRAQIVRGTHTNSLRQSWEIDRPRAGATPSVHLVVRGRLDRPALAEITELSPPSPTGADLSIDVAGATIVLRASLLPAEVTIRIDGGAARWSVADGLGRATLVWPTHGSLAFTVTVEMATMTVPIGVVARPPAEQDRLIRAALTYIRGCTALAVASDECAILTDHRILPLSWTRDAYWQALALLAGDEPGDRERVADHLRWLWRRCERPDGLWARSHHADGRRKDLAFQADQQLYPIVELADLWRLDGRLPAGVDWSAELDRTWSSVVGVIDPELGLVPSAETAADDPSEAPFIGAAQILLWYAAERTRELAAAGAVTLDPVALGVLADRVRRAFVERITTADGGAWAYAVDPDGSHVAYHDANDLPVALAPWWGFCPSDDVGWRSTMAFAFSRANAAWVPGPSGGLGSIHTPGTWTLGDIQAWITAHATGDEVATANALARMETVAFDDGMLPEAYDPVTHVPIRHWFAWPGAALAALRLLDRAGQLARLSARRGR